MSISNKKTSVLVRTDSGISNFTAVSSKKIKEPFVPANYVRYGMNERDVLLYKEIFDMMDPKRKGVVSPNDFRATLQSLGIHISRSDLYNLFCDYDKDENGVLTFDDFIEAISGGIRPCDEDKAADYKRVFSKLSGNKNFITKEDLLKTLRGIGLQQSESDFEKMYKRLGVVNEKITFEQFYKTMTDFIYGESSAMEELELFVEPRAHAKSLSVSPTKRKKTLIEPLFDAAEINKTYGRSKTSKIK